MRPIKRGEIYYTRLPTAQRIVDGEAVNAQITLTELQTLLIGDSPDTRVHISVVLKLSFLA